MATQTLSFDRESVASITTERQALSLVRKAGTEWKATDARTERATVHAAYATYAAMMAGYVAGDKTRGVTAAKAKVSSAKYLADFFTPESAVKPMTDSNVSAWKTCGIALVEVGVDPDSRLFRLIARGGHGYAKVRDEIRLGANTTPAKVEAKLSLYVDLATGKVRPESERIANKVAKKAASSGNATDEANAKALGKLAETLTARDPFDAANALIREWSKAASAVSDLAKRSDLEEGMRQALDTFAKASVTMATESRKAAKKSTAKKSTAKKAASTPESAPVAVAS